MFWYNARTLAKLSELGMISATWNCERSKTVHGAKKNPQVQTADLSYRFWRFGVELADWPD
jgi:hypothetical protein